MDPRFAIASEDSRSASELRTRMQAFYDSVEGYDAFAETNRLEAFWEAITGEVSARCNSEKCRILEFGAGRTGFGAYLGELRSRVEFHVQDVTRVNEDHLRGVADKVWINDLKDIAGEFDVIFSTFVWEHLCNPRGTLMHLLQLLSPAGCLVLASPRYDVPGYVPPSARRLSRRLRALLSAELLWRRARVVLGARPDFLIHCQPACLNGPWYRDADAIHWVSRYDLKLIEPEYEVETLRIPTHGWKHWLWARLIVLFVRIQRRGVARGTGRTHNRGLRR